MDSRTAEERERDSKIEVTTTTVSIHDKQEWEERFDERDDIDWHLVRGTSELKSFIRKVETEAYERGRQSYVKQIAEDVKDLADK